jgi:hypothetical protein
MPSLQEILLAFLLPGCMVGVGLLAVARSAGASDRQIEIAGACAFGVAYLVAHSVLLGWPAWPSGDRTLSALEWQAWTIAALIPCALLCATSRRVPAIAFVALAASFVYLALRRWMHGAGSPWLAALFLAAMIGAWASTDALVRRSPGVTPVPALLVSVITASVCSLLGHSAVVAELAGALCVCLGASAVVAVLAPRFRLARGAVVAILLVLTGVLLNGVFFSDVHWSSALLTVLSLGAPWIAARGGSRTRVGWKPALIRAALAAVFGAAAVLLAQQHAPTYEY